MTGECVRTGAHDFATTALFELPNNTLVIGEYSGSYGYNPTGTSLCYWNLNESTPLYRKLPSLTIFAFVVLNDKLMGCGCFGKIDIRNIDDGELQYSLLGYSNYVNDMILLEDLVTLVSAGSDNTVKAWNWQTRECLSTLKGHSGQVASVAEFNKGVVVSCGMEDQQIKFWNLTDGQCVKTIESEENCWMSNHGGALMNREGVLVTFTDKGMIRYFY